MKFVMQAIGTIYSPFTEVSGTPIQPTRSQAIGQVSVFPEYAEGLADLEGFSHIILLYAFHRACGYELKIKSFLDDAEHGLFSTRYPCRPNPIGLSVVRLMMVNKNILDIEGVDVIDGTPLLDIKPYVPDFDIRSGVRSGWYETRSKK
jgi:tRNA-Thr(GGU) m(6)t(6)A37 methyltransferase TsaA